MLMAQRAELEATDGVSSPSTSEKDTSGNSSEDETTDDTSNSEEIEEAA